MKNIKRRNIGRICTVLRNTEAPHCDSQTCLIYPSTTIHHRHDGSVIEQKKTFQSQIKIKVLTPTERQLLEFVDLTFAEVESSVVFRIPLLTFFTDSLCNMDPR